MVVTDSGGLQKEAFFNKKHCIIARDETEWTELVKNGFGKIVGSDKDKILSAYKSFKASDSNFNINLYGNQVGDKIYQEIKKII
jgi:UDP-GlcNAc3NAcA epimerase